MWTRLAINHTPLFAARPVALVAPFLLVNFPSRRSKGSRRNTRNREGGGGGLSTNPELEESMLSLATAATADDAGAGAKQRAGAPWSDDEVCGGGVGGGEEARLAISFAARGHHACAQT